MFINKFITCFLCILVYTVTCETCVKSDGSIGNCVKISDCPSVYAFPREGEVPKLAYQCDFSSQEDETLICCEANLEKEDESFPPGCKKVWNKNRRKPVTILIINDGIGIDSLANEFPHMAALGYDGEDNKTVWACGGTLITTEHVLTAAHCLHSKNMGDVKYVRLGDLNLNSNKDVADPQNFKVIEKIRHPDYHYPSPYHDLAIVKLDKPCRISSFVIPACLNTKKEFPNETYSATGWGQKGYGEPLADHLQNMIISLYNHTDCQKVYSNFSKRRLHKGIDKETQVCAGSSTADTCPGDSGGPLQLRRRDDNTVYGVTSFGVVCGISKIPGVYIKVSPYISWIKSVIELK